MRPIINAQTIVIFQRKPADEISDDRIIVSEAMERGDSLQHRIFPAIFAPLHRTDLLQNHCVTAR